MGELDLLFIPTPSKEPKTGGEAYELKLFQFLKEHFGNVKPMEINVFRRRAKNDPQILLFGFTGIIRNLLYIFEIMKKKNGHRTVVLEDSYYSTDLFLFNFFVRCVMRNISTVPIVHHLYYQFRKRRLFRIVLKLVETLFLNESDWIIVNSEATEKDVKALLWNEKTLLVAHPGVGEEKMGGREGLSRNMKNRGILNILAVGSVGERKDYETLLKAVGTLISRCEVDFLVNVVGHLGDTKDLQKKMLETADDPSLSRRVLFRGRITDYELRDLYAKSDIFVSTSLHEGFGMAIAEAMCNSLPVVATNSGAIPYLVEDRVNGFLVPPRDYRMLARRIRVLLESEELRKQMGTKGFRKAKEFDWTRTFSKIYGRLLEA